MVLLINPQSNSGLTEMRQPSTGLAYIGAFLFLKGINVKAIDAKVDNLLPVDVIKKASEMSFNVVGITAMTPDIKTANIIAKGIKEKNSKSLIIVGGAHAMALPEDTLNEFDGFDVVVIGEGEFTVFDLVSSYSQSKRDETLRDIPGIVFRKEDGSLYRTRSRKPIEDIDSLPFPKWELFSPVDFYPVYGGRGCPYQCNFCQRILGNRVRKRSPENIIDEILHLVKDKGINYFWFDDETFGTDKKWLNNLLDLMNDNAVAEHCSWSANSRVNIADVEMYKKMRKAGCHRVSFGIESGDDSILQDAKKGFNVEKAIGAINKAKSAGLQIGAFYILGHPNETLKQVLKTIRLAARINAQDSSIGIMIPYPGTEIYEMAKKGLGGYTSLSKDWDRYTKYFGNPMEFENFSAKTLERIQLLGFLWVYLRNFRFNMIWSEFIRRKSSIMARMRNMFRL